MKAWYVSKFRREQRTECQCPLCGKVGAVEVFQPRLVIFRAEPSIDASIRTFVPSKCVSSLVPRQSSTNFSMTAPGAMNNHIQAKSVCPARESNPRPSAFRADALTTTLRGWDDSTRRNFVTQLVTVLLEHPRACAMETTPAAANGS